jgi:molecular chaperone DnaJ
MSADPYATLGVSRDASTDEIKKAYRKLAHKHHPDKGGTPEDEAKFREVNAAYQILSDPQKRQQFDQFGAAGQQGAGGPGGPGFGGFDFGGGFGGGFAGFDSVADIFEQFFSGGASATQRGPQRGADLEMSLKLSFNEAVKGVSKKVRVNRRVTCGTCHGNGAEPNTKIVKCDRCDGAGEIRTTRQTILGMMQQVTACPVCHGEGKKPEKPCHTCGGEGRVQKEEELPIDIPAGIDDGQTIRVPGQGEVGQRGASPGHLYVTVRVEESKVFERSGSDIRVLVPVSYPQAVLGAEITVPTLDGKTTLKVPAGTPSGKIIKLKGEGIPKLNSGNRGDEYVMIEVVIPEKPSDDEKRLIEDLAKVQGDPISRKSWKDKLGL